MSALEAFAPGKLFVIGEYAVLAGGRALVAAVDAGIACRVERAASWRLAAPDLGVEGPLDAALADAPLLAAAAIRAREEFRLDAPLSFTVRGATVSSRSKHGLGGSAASVVAILAAAAASAGIDVESQSARARLFSIAFDTHRRHQRGRGSGADVAASVYGGWLEYALGEGGPKAPKAPKAPMIAAAALPAGFCLAAVWSGVASDTAGAIRSFDSASASPLAAILDEFWGAVDRQDRGAMLSAIDAYGAALQDLQDLRDIDGGAPGTRRIAELVRIARGDGVAAKGSGAIGGDCAIACAFEATALAALAEKWRAAGAEPLAVSVDGRGVRLVLPAASEELHA